MSERQPSRQEGIVMNGNQPATRQIAQRRASAWKPPRETIRREVTRRGWSLSELSGIIGRHKSYVPRYVAQGVPAQLAEKDRSKIERYLGLPPGELSLELPQ